MKRIYKKIKMFSNESYRNLDMQNISDTNPIMNVSKKGDPLSPRPHPMLYNMLSEGFSQSRSD
jgi:hypothetical protein